MLLYSKRVMKKHFSLKPVFVAAMRHILPNQKPPHAARLFEGDAV
jgi:hypothetical protein